MNVTDTLLAVSGLLGGNGRGGSAPTLTAKTTYTLGAGFKTLTDLQTTEV